MSFLITLRFYNLIKIKLILKRYLKYASKRNRKMETSSQF